jgi:hypothetical protein
MYPASLELKTVCKSPEAIQYLDLEVRHDRGGFYTLLYDKRDALRDEGKMDVVRRFPHPTSVLSEQCRYGCLVSFLHRASRCDMRTKAFVAHAAGRMVEMFQDGYDAAKLVRKLRSFMETFHQPSFRWRAVSAQIEQRFARERAEVTQQTHEVLFPEGTPMAVRKPKPSTDAQPGPPPARRLDFGSTDQQPTTSQLDSAQDGSHRSVSPDGDGSAALLGHGGAAGSQPSAVQSVVGEGSIPGDVDGGSSLDSLGPPTHVGVMTPVSWLAQIIRGVHGNDVTEEWEVAGWQPFDPADTSLDVTSAPIVRAWVAEG